MISITHKIIAGFDKAASSYDQAASLQQQVAENLVAHAAAKGASPQNVLDIGAGTGLVAEALHRAWPQTHITAIDPAPQMLLKAQKKIPALRIIEGNALASLTPQSFDAIFSSMMLHWLPEPIAALQHWQKFLKPNGTIFAALLIDGSFQEWRDLCRKNNVNDGLWPMPLAHFADDLNPVTDQQTITIPYATARDFLDRLKATGAATPRNGHKPLSPAIMRKILHNASQPFVVTYRVLYIENSLQGRV